MFQNVNYYWQDFCQRRHTLIWWHMYCVQNKRGQTILDMKDVLKQTRDKWIWSRTELVSVNKAIPKGTCSLTASCCFFCQRTVNTVHSKCYSLCRSMCKSKVQCRTSNIYRLTFLHFSIQHFELKRRYRTTAKESLFWV